MAERERTIDFPTFLISIGSSALVHLGHVPDPESGKNQPVNLKMAQQSIDLLALLQEKTRNNLTADEARFLETLLYDLRVKYVAAAKNPQPPPEPQKQP